MVKQNGQGGLIGKPSTLISVVFSAALILCASRAEAVRYLGPPVGLPVVYGDLNGDGKVTAVDASFVLAHLDGRLIIVNPLKLLAADVDQDEKITASDGKLVLAAAVGKIDKLPARFGDVNGDGKVTAIDATLIMRYMKRMTVLNRSQLFLADVNEDGQITAKDVRLVLDYVTGRVGLLPPPVSASDPALKSPSVWVPEPPPVTAVLNPAVDKKVVNAVVERNGTIQEKKESSDPRMVPPPDVRDQTRRDTPKK